MARRENLTAEFLRQILIYDPETGLFIWRHRSDASAKWNSRWAGKPAGSLNGNGYLVIKIQNRAYGAHRLAWLYAKGEWPDFVDHADMIRSNNILSNLRSCDMSQNKANMRKRADNTTGLKGVSFMKDRKKWRAQLGSVGGPAYLGEFDCPAAAHFAYIIAADLKYGEFTRAS